MYQPKQGFAQAAQATALPEICMVVAYNKDKTFRLFNREGNTLVPCNRCNWDKWELVDTGMEKALAEKLECAEVHVLKTNSQRNRTGAVGL